MDNSGYKKWGKGEFWGLTSDYDPDWVLTEDQKELRTKLIELCRTKIRPNAAHYDKTYEYPRESLNALAELGLLGLIVPKSLGGLGENHVGAMMVLETIARYGCPSTAMVYTMHLSALGFLLFRYHDNPLIQDLLRRLDEDKLVGSLSYSDPATGSHFWYPLTSKTKQLDNEQIQILKYCSWVTSAGQADWYTIQAVSPDPNAHFSELSMYLLFKDEVRSSSEDWSALGMHGNQSGPMVVEGKIPANRIVGSFGDAMKGNNESVGPYFLLLTSCCWNGISLGCMDVAKKHVTRKAHADVGMRVCDYPVIQDYFGKCLASTSISRSYIFFLAQIMDKDTNNNDWSLHSDPDFTPRTKYMQWLWIAKYESSKNVTKVTDTMLHACGGAGYKTDVGLERLLRDGKAGWVMSLSNEVLQQFIGKSALLGFDSIDYWGDKCNERQLHQEVGKMTLSQKKELAKSLLSEIDQEEKGEKPNHPHQDTDFENPFNTGPPRYLNQKIQGDDGKMPLSPHKWTKLSLRCREEVGKNMSVFIFNLPNIDDHTGCYPGQFIKVRATFEGRIHERYLSPISDPSKFGQLEVMLRFETRGVISHIFQSLKKGDELEFLGPCGGFEYEPNQLDELTLMVSGAGVTPALQLLRCVRNNPSDKIKCNLIYYADTFEELLCKKELDSYAASDGRIRIYYTLNEAPEEWEGGEGYIDTKMIDEHVTKPNGTKHKIVMCGGTTMIINCLYSLQSLKFPSNMIFIYGQFGVEQIRKIYGRKALLCSHTCL